MKILHLTQFLGIGGLEKVLFELAKKQLQQGHHVEVMVYDYEKSWVSKFKDSNILVDDQYQKSEGFDVQLLKYLKNKVHEFDIIHSHDLNPMIYLAFLKMANPKIKILHTCHGHEDIKKFKIRFFEIFFTRFASEVISVSDEIHNFYKNTLIGKKNLSVIHNGVNFNLEKLPSTKMDLCSRYKLDPNKPIWVYVARFDKNKNQVFLKEVFAKLPKQQLLLIGPVSDNYLKDFKDLTSNISLTGPRSNIDYYLRGCDYFISASRHEGLPIAVLEALSYNVPCLLSDIVAHKKLITNNQNKLLFKNDDIADCISKIRYFSEEKDQIVSIQKKVLMNIKRSYSIESMYQKYQLIYHKHYAI